MVFGLKAHRLAAVAAACGLGLLAMWLLPFCREQRHLFYKDYVYSAQEAQRLDRHAGILFAYGLHAEGRLDAAAAADYYRRATALDPLYMDAWLRLADQAAASGDAALARRIAAFCNETIGPVVHWKWRLTLLAHSLAMEKIFDANLNYMVARGNRLDDAFYLLDTHCQGDPVRSLAVLRPENRPAYLAWAIRWRRPEDAHAAWQAVAAGPRVDKGLVADYVNFLVSEKETPAAAAVWRQYTGVTGMTNPGFEEEITDKGFDWHTFSDRAGHWEVRRDPDGGRRGGTALRISFYGGANVAFQHVYQVTAVTPEKPYRLAFWWRDKALSTDQVPFVEVYSYDAKGLYARSRALQGAHEWQSAAIDFTPPADCHAVVVRVRRIPSNRFDNKIRGTIWLDDFELIPNS